MMTKNAITVIDQELIDRFVLMVSVKEDHETVSVTAGELSELIYMAKDLIEINAELTKREQKQLVIIKSLLKFHTSVAMQSHSSYELAHEYINEIKRR